MGWNPVADIRGPQGEPADESNLVHRTGVETISGLKTFVNGIATAQPSAANMAIRNDDARLSDARTPTAHVHAAGDITSGTVAYARLPVGSTASTVAAGNDPRLSDARTPTTHTHAASSVTAAPRTVTYANLPAFAPAAGVAVDAATCTLTGNPTITPATGVDRQVVRLALYAGASTRTVTFASAVRLSTGITTRAVTVPAEQVAVVGLEYLSVISAWVLFSAYVTAV